jgi:hypothetical protein
MNFTLSLIFGGKLELINNLVKTLKLCFDCLNTIVADRMNMVIAKMSNNKRYIMTSLKIGSDF